MCDFIHSHDLLAYVTKSGVNEISIILCEIIVFSTVNRSILNIKKVTPKKIKKSIIFIPLSYSDLSSN